MRRRLETIGPVVACLLANTAAAWPVLAGGWIYDDWAMRNNPAMTHASDLVAAFGRTSAAYLNTPPSIAALGVTYRPLSFASLIAVQAFLSEAPWAHHAVSLALHFAAVCLLATTLYRYVTAPLTVLCTIAFALHPVGIEAYGWINGRSDVLAGVGVALLVRAMFRGPSREGDVASRMDVAVAALAAAVAVLAKETAVVAVLGVVLSSLVPPVGWPTRESLRRHAVPAIAASGAVAACLALRSWAIAREGAGAAAPLHAGSLITSVMHLIGMALEGLAVPSARTMANLAFELSRAWSTTAVALLCAASLAWLWLLATRHFRAALLWLTAGATLAPCVAVTHAFWLGFDRYLYMPLFLLCASVAFTPVATWFGRLRPGAQRASGLLLACLLIPSTFITAQGYEDQPSFMAALVTMRPGDPSGYLVGARWLANAKELDRARELLARVPTTGLPASLASQHATRLAEVGLTKQALEVVDDMERRFPEDPYVQLDVLSVRLGQKQLAAASSVAEKLRGRGRFCLAARALLEEHERASKDPEHRAQLKSALDGYRCP